MKKSAKIFSLAIAAVMTTTIAASAMTFNEPMSFEFALDKYGAGENAFTSGTGQGYILDIYGYQGDNYYDNGYTPDGATEKTVDSFDGTTNYLHIGSNKGNSPINFYVMQDRGDSATKTRHIGSFGKSRLEAVIRLDDYIGENKQSQMGNENGTCLFLVHEIVTEAGGTNHLGLRGYYSAMDESNNVIGVRLRTNGTTTNEQHLQDLLFGKWYKITIDVDVQNKKIEYIFDTYKDDASGEIESTKTYTYDIPTIQCTAGAWMRSPAQLFSTDLAELKVTRDTVSIKELTVDDTAADSISATVKAASNAPANDYTRIVYDEVNNAWVEVTGTLWTYDNVAGADKYISKTASPTLILAQYDETGKLLKLDSKSIEVAPLSWGRTARESDTRPSAAKGGITYQDISVSFAKEAGYSYSKAYVWDGMSKQVPFANLVSTKSEAAEEAPAE